MGWIKRDPVAPGSSTDLDRALNQLRARIPGCPPPAMLQAAQAEVLPADQAREIGEHLTKCPLCKSLLADLEVLDTAELDGAGRARIWKQLRAGMPAEHAGRSSAWQWFRPLPISGAVALLLILVASALVIRNREKPEVVVLEARAPASPLQAPSVFRLEKAPVILPAAGAVLWRGQQDSAVTQVNELKRALAPYQEDNYAEAARRLEALHNKYPHMAAAGYYLGICRLFMGRNDDAATILQDAINQGDSTFSVPGTWYLALADYRTSRVEAALALLEPLCRTGGPDSGRACSGIQQLKQHR